jgi:STE24 endopeptidase
MNAYALLILAALLADYAVNVAADVLNLRALRPELPPEFSDVYDAASYRRSQEYTRARTHLGFVTSTFELAVLLVFWWSGGFGDLDRFARGFGWGPVGTGLVFVGALMLARGLLALPFRYWSTFVLEERFGFNRSTRATFWADLLKGTALGALLGGLLLAAVIAFFERFGAGAWLLCWAFVAVLTVLLQFLAPTWILPLFNKFTPLDEGELRDRIVAYSSSVGFPLAGLFVIDGSRRSTKANAFFTGFGKRKRVALYDTLIAKHATDELVAVVAHEIGHYKKKHILQGMALSLLHTGLLFALLAFFLREEALFSAFGVQQPSTYAGLVFFGLLYTPVELILQLLLQAFSRRNEFEADRYAAATTGLWRELAQGLKRLSADSLSNLTPHPLYVALHHSHPPLARRIEALRREWGGGR